MAESVRILWIYSMHKCAQIHDAMTSVTNLAHRTSEQHVELGNARRQRDSTDVTKVINWLTAHNPFDVNLQSLRSLSPGLTASDSDGINCEEMEEAGRLLQQKLENVNVLDVSVKRSDKVITLANMQKCVKIDKKSVHVDPNTLFTRLVLLLERYEDVISYFKYELTFPTSLFKDSQMRKTNKAALANHLISDVQMSHCPQNVKYVLDGGAFFHRVKWPPNAPCKEVIMQCLRYVKSKYGIQWYTVVVLPYDFCKPGADSVEQKE